MNSNDMLLNVAKNVLCNRIMQRRHNANKMRFLRMCESARGHETIDSIRDEWSKETNRFNQPDITDLDIENEARKFLRIL